jgi:hypothetical protein
LELEDIAEENLTDEFVGSHFMSGIELTVLLREVRDYEIYKQLLSLSPKLEERLYNGSEQDVYHVADLVSGDSSFLVHRAWTERFLFEISKGSSNARADDTRALKSAIVDWITPRGGVLVPPLQRNVKSDRGFHHNRTGELLCPATMDWQDSR